MRDEAQQAGHGADPVVIVGAYAALPRAMAEQERFHDALAAKRTADGLEIPFRDALADDPAWLAEVCRGRFTRSVLTLIPGTMMRVAAMGTFGLASPDAEGRRAALSHLLAARRAAEDLNQRTGEQTVSVLHIHSAPTAIADAGMLARSLDEHRHAVAPDGEWSTELVLEHCDACSPETPGEKRFLPLSEEIAVARAAGIGMAVNWGRSVIEAQSADRALEHIEELAAHGLLRGLVFSGAGPTPNAFGGPWADAHLPLAEDEPASLLDEAAVRRCLAAAGPLEYAGAKIQVPADAEIGQRVRMIGRITDIVRAAARPS